MPKLAGTVADAFAARIREQEEVWLSPLAVRSYETRGRLHAEDDCRLRTPFQRDRDRIVHSKSFRRLKHKTQVFIDPSGDHYRTRLTHTLETTGISRGVARALRLNEDLTEAIGLGHDLGHPAFGHAGEEALDAALRERFGLGFRHNEHSLRVVDHLERDGRGINLTAEVSPSNAFNIGATARNKKRGTATLPLAIPNPGEVTVSGKGVKSADASTSRAVVPGPVSLLIKAKGKKKRKLNRTGKVNLAAKISFAPTGGSPSIQTRKIKLQKRL